MTHYFPRPKILSRVPDHGHVVIEASAGTGKTFTLENLIAHLVISGSAPLEKLLVVTFTDRAASELAERARGTLERALTGVEAVEAGPHTFEIGEAAKARLAAALAAFDAASISTIHAFGQRLLAEQAFSSRRLFDESVVDGRSAFARTARVVLRRVLASDELGDLLEHTLRGETVEDLEAFLFACHEQQGDRVPKWDAEALRSSISAIPDKVRVRAEISALAVGRRISAVTLRKLDEHVAALYSVAGSKDQGHAFRQWADQEIVLDREPGRRLDRVSATVAGLIGVDGSRGFGSIPLGRSKTLLSLLQALEVADAAAAPPRARLAQSLLPMISDALRAEKADLGRLDFDDMLGLVAEALRSSAGPGSLRETLRDRYSHVLIDEFQDTDEVQWSVFQKAFYDPPHRLFLVGDPKQAIYGFRNADVFTYRRAVEEIRAGGGSVLELVDNYRSSPALLGTIDRIVGRDFFTGGNRAGESAQAAFPSARLEDGQAREVEPLVVWRVEDELSAAELYEALGPRVAREIDELVVTCPLWHMKRGGARKLRFADVQILTRTRLEGESIARALAAQGIPHAFHRPEGLFETAEADEILALLRAIQSPDDRSRRARAYLTSFFDVPLDRLEASIDRDLDPRADKLLRFAALAERREYARLFEAILSETGLVRRLLFSRSSESEALKYRQIFDVLAEELGGVSAGLDELIARLVELREGLREPLARDGRALRVEGGRDAVQILTMHKAKGLEAPVVFLVGGFTRRERDELPAIAHVDGRRLVLLTRPTGQLREAMRREAREEAERLMYVALTRAESRVYTVLPPETPAFGGVASVVSARIRKLLSEGGDSRIRVEALVRHQPSPKSEVSSGPLPPLGFGRASPVRVDATFRDRFRIRTSYTRLTRHDESTSRDFALGEADEPVGPESREFDPLPGGREIGILVHSLFERADFDRVSDAPDADAWLSSAATRHYLREAITRNRAVAAHVEAAARLVFRALKCPISLPRLHLPRGLCSLSRRSAEVDLTFSIPELDHPTLGTLGNYQARRGVVVGSIDLLFELDGRYFILDWKSDRLTSYESAELRRRFAASYELQAKIYATAVVRGLGALSRVELESKLGGAIYAFVRGMNSLNAGIHVWAPCVDEIARAIEELRRHPDLERFG
ncbi:MAG: UvrD-helicase domain-containing protein [Deltaproteobacteria bacterium]|nr:UvrD-helicase domain-containing protein [Deltaproteobacteria bacterium]